MQNIHPALLTLGFWLGTGLTCWVIIAVIEIFSGKDFYTFGEALASFILATLLGLITIYIVVKDLVRRRQWKNLPPGYQPNPYMCSCGNFAPLYVGSNVCKNCGKAV